MASLSLTREQEKATGGDRAVGIWLLSVCGMIFAMALIGAITRLTGSGLSIMEWAPISGALPPMSEAEWRRVFDLYRSIPQYEQVNRGMSLEEFRTIFWWEWIHRQWGRLIGVAFLGGFLWLWLRGKLRAGLTPHIVALFALGALQAFIGWYMVESGFGERTSVSQYRLALHLGLALIIYAYALTLALSFLAPKARTGADSGALRAGLWGFLGLVSLTILAGAFVAGLSAGLTYNTFPLMDGRVVPVGYGFQQPWIMNWFENPAAVQFNHRLLGVLTVVAAFALWLYGRRLELAATARRALDWLALAALAQVALGVATLLAVVPVWLATLHQGGAIVLLSLAIWALLRVPPHPSENEAKT